MERQPELGRPLGSEGRDYIMMRGAYLPGNSSVVLRDLPVPEPGHGEVLLRMKASTICGSDIRCIYYEHLGKEPAQTQVNPVRPVRIELRRHGVEGVGRVLGNTRVVKGEVSEERSFAVRSRCGAVTIGAIAFAQEELEAVVLLFGQLGLVVEVGVKLGAEGIHLLRPLVGSDRTGDVFIGQRNVSGREGSRSPHLFEERGVGGCGHRRHDRSGTGIVLFERVEERTLRLFGQRVAESPASGAPVPEHAADEGAGPGVEVENRAVTRVGGCRGLAVAEPAWNRSLIDSPGGVDRRIGAGEADLRAVTRGAGLG